MSRTPDRSVSVTVGEGVVTLRRSGQSSPITANILGMDTDQEGNPTCIWLDRIVHQTGERHFTEWDVHGAVSSVLVRNDAATRGN